MATFLCPECYQHELRLVGAYVYTPSGVDIGDDRPVTIDDLNKDDAFLSQSVYLCSHCKKHFKEHELVSSEIEKLALHWVPNFEGQSIPVVCPKCKNTTEFVEVSLVLLEHRHPIDFSQEEALPIAVHTYPDDEDLKQRVPLRYACAKCDGVVRVNSGAFKVTRL